MSPGSSRLGLESDAEHGTAFGAVRRPDVRAMNISNPGSDGKPEPGPGCELPRSGLIDTVETIEHLLQSSLWNSRARIFDDQLEPAFDLDHRYSDMPFPGREFQGISDQVSQ